MADSLYLGTIQSGETWMDTTIIELQLNPWLVK